VGESNVVEKMRSRKGVIGGEGNGGVIFPSFHAGRDSLIAAALVLSCLASEGKTLGELVETFPVYYTIKGKSKLLDGFTDKLQTLVRQASQLLGVARVDQQDGVRFDLEDGWVQIRISNTEPIYRVIAESNNRKRAQQLYRVVTRFLK
jgi:phosphomannomutase